MGNNLYVFAGLASGAGSVEMEVTNSNNAPGAPQPPEAPAPPAASAAAADPLDANIGQYQSMVNTSRLPSETSEEASQLEEASPLEETTEEAPPSAPPSEDEWAAVYKTWRRGNQLWLMTSGGGPSGGYIIDYSSERRAISR